MRQAIQTTYLSSKNKNMSNSDETLAQPTEKDAFLPAFAELSKLRVADSNSPIRLQLRFRIALKDLLAKISNFHL